MNIRGLGVCADLFWSGWAAQTGLTNDPMGSAAAGGISDSLMRPQAFCAYRKGEGRCGGETKSGIDAERCAVK